MGGLVYFASHQPIECLSPRPIKSYNSMATWFTSSAEYARKLYGPIVYGFELPEGRYLEAHTDNFDEFFLNWPLAEETLSKRDLAHLRQHPPVRSLPTTYPERGHQEKTRSIMRKLLLDPDYIAKFRAVIEGAGYDGIVFPDSRIDLRPNDREPHTIFLVFQHGELCPVVQV